MTKEVTVKVEGTQLGEAGVWEDPILLTARGSYHELNDRHYVQYEEETEEGRKLIRNMLKISLNRIEMTKKGAAVSQMTFDVNDITQASYQTPYGSLTFEVRTSKLTVEETKEQLEVRLEYALYSNDIHISDNRTMIKINAIR